jgi:phosphotransferase system enzyme I (PtsI)
MKKSEQIIQAVAVSSGLAIANIQLMPSEIDELNLSSMSLKSSIHSTLEYWQHLIEKAKDQLNAQIKRYRLAKAESGILKAHLEILKDPGFQRDILQHIQQGDTIKLALERVLDKWKAKFKKLKKALFRDRLLDLQDVVLRLLRLCKRPGRKKKWPEATCIYSKQALPSNLVEVPSDKLKAVLCQDVSKASHLALLARAKGIPCLSKISLPAGSDRCLAVIDGDTGCLILNPTHQTLAKYQEKLQRQLDLAQRIPKISIKSKLTIQSRFWANIDTWSDVAKLPTLGYEGIGLVRTEYLAFEKKGLPTFEEQLQFYKRLIKSQKGKPVVIRLFDFGSDKPYGQEHIKELNPALGCRGIRYLLKNLDILRDQLSALLLASCEGPLSILVPMVCHPKQMELVQTIAKQIATDLKIATMPKIGMMVEVPAAALTLEQFFSFSDFFSIGSNDLLQYVHAVDRANSVVQELYDPLSKALIELIKLVVVSAKKADKPVSLCGEMASDPIAREILQKNGLKDFSLSPQSLRKSLGMV